MDVALSGGNQELSMSEHAIKAALSGASSITGNSVSGSYPVPIDGNIEFRDGNQLPKAAIESPDLERLAQELNVASQRFGNDLRFQVNLDKGPVVLQVVDRETGEVIRQIPQEKATVVLNENGLVRIRLFDELV